jgi:predicted nucleic acid-binding protein
MGALILAKRSRIYLDTNVFVAAYESIGARSDHGWWILEAAEKGEYQIVTSELTLAELLVRPISEGNDELRAIYEAILSNSEEMMVVPVRREVLIASARLRSARAGLRMPDAIHCATAMMNNCSAMVSDDARLPKGLDVEIVPFGPGVLNHLRVMAQ